MGTPSILRCGHFVYTFTLAPMCRVIGQPRWPALDAIAPLRSSTLPRFDPPLVLFPAPLWGSSEPGHRPTPASGR